MANHEVKKARDVWFKPEASTYTMVLDRSDDWPKRINDDSDCALSLPTEHYFPEPPRQ